MADLRRGASPYRRQVPGSGLAPRLRLAGRRGGARHIAAPGLAIRGGGYCKYLERAERARRPGAAHERFVFRGADSQAHRLWRASDAPLPALVVALEDASRALAQDLEAGRYSLRDRQPRRYTLGDQRSSIRPRERAGLPLDLVRSAGCGLRYRLQRALPSPATASLAPGTTCACRASARPRSRSPRCWRL